MDVHGAVRLGSPRRRPDRSLFAIRTTGRKSTHTTTKAIRNGSLGPVLVRHGVRMRARTHLRSVAAFDDFAWCALRSAPPARCSARAHALHSPIHALTRSSGSVLDALCASLCVLAAPASPQRLDAPPLPPSSVRLILLSLSNSIRLLARAPPSFRHRSQSYYTILLGYNP
jgi:hypothetical protein